MQIDPLLQTGFFLHISFAENNNDNNLIKPDTKHQIKTQKWTASLDVFHQTKIISFEKQKAICVLLGNVYSTKIDEKFAASFQKNPLNAAKELNGSWALVFFDLQSNCINIVTDRFNSWPVFMYKNPKNKEIILVTSLEYFPKNLRHPDWTGVGWKLINGVPHCSRTILKDIQKLNRSSIYNIDSHSIKHQEYWKLEFTENFSRRSVSSLKKDFSDILELAVKRRITNHFPVIISLSSGYDSPLILGVLSKYLKQDEIVCFSYELPQPKKDSDASVAKILAQKTGFSHHIIPSFDGDILKLLNLNAVYGSGIANFCDEAHAWQKAHAMFPTEPPLFVGDCFVGWKTRPYRTVKDVLKYLRIGEPKELNRFSPFFPKQIIKKMIHGVESDINTLIEGITETKMENIRDFFWFDQRLNNYLMPWRPFFWGRGFSIRYPLLDNNVIDFTKELPPDLRTEKILYRETCHDMFPSLFSIPRAQSENYKSDYNKELFSQKEALLRAVLSQKDSPLAEEWQYESFVDFISKYFKQHSEIMIRSKIGKMFKRLSKKTSNVPKYYYNRYLSPTLDKTKVLLSALSILGFVFDINFKK